MLTPEQAWKASVDQLRLEMNKTYFEKWVAPAKLLEFQEGMFKISVPDEYTRDWLDSRVKRQIVRMITGVLGREVDVTFEVMIDEPESDREDETVLESSVNIEEVFQSLRTSITQPDRIVVVPKYLLRWVPLISPDMFWMVVAFRQARFLSTVHTDQSKPFTARADEIYRWCGMSRATFWRNIDRPELGWFIERLPQNNWGVDAGSGRPKQNPNRYRMMVDLPITPMDAEDLRNYLQSSGFQDDPIKALQNSLQVTPGQIFRYPSPRPAPYHRMMEPQPATVSDVIKDLLQEQDQNSDVQRQVVSLSEQLADRLLRPLENIQISWYFLQEWLPELGAAPALFVVLLRSLGYFNAQTGELRDQVWIDGGYEEIAQVLGIERTKTVVSWLPGLTDRGPRVEKVAASTQKERERTEKLRQLLPGFLERIGYRANQHGSYSFQFRVKLDVEPLTSLDHDLVNWAEDFVQTCEKRGVFDLFQQWLYGCELETFIGTFKETNSIYETLNSDRIPYLRLSGKDNSRIETLNRLLKSSFETLQSAGIPFLRLFKVLTGLKTLKPLLENPSTIEEALDDMDKPVEEWNLKDLLERNHVSTKKQAVLLKAEKSAQAFVSWLIYAASPRGEAIKDPVSLAISKLFENPGEGAGGAYDRLAALTKDRFSRMVTAELDLRSPGEQDWTVILRGATHIRLRQLAEELGIERNQ